MACPLYKDCERVIALACDGAAPALRLPSNKIGRLLVAAGDACRSLKPEMVRRFNEGGLANTLQKAITELGDFDRIWIDEHRFGEPVRRAVGDRPIVVDADDIYTIAASRYLASKPRRLSTAFQYLDLAKLRRYERSLPRRYWRCIVAKPEDREFFDAAPNVFVVPNGVAEFPASSPADEQPGEMLFVGTLTFFPNVDAVKWFTSEALPGIRKEVPGARLRIVGNNPTPDVIALGGIDGVTVHGSVPELDPFYTKASVVVVPIRSGSGTKLKVLEALSRGKAVVSTSRGAEGLNLQSDVHCIVADDAATFVDACVRLLRGGETRQKLGTAGREHVLKHFGWNEVDRAVQAVISEESPSAQV